MKKLLATGNHLQHSRVCGRRGHATASAPAAAKHKSYDYCVVGGGIVGLATARELLLRDPKARVAVLEKENAVGLHQTGHNSGVIHAGIYYAPGSLKAKLCVEGLHRMYAYCEEHRIPHRRCGKLIVAANETELPGLQELFRRGQLNGVPDLAMVDTERMRQIEPHCSGVAAIHSPHTGIVDYQVVAESYAKEVRQQGADLRTGSEVVGFAPLGGDSEEVGVRVDVRCRQQNQQLECRHVITCGGAWSDRLAALSGGSVEPMIVPFRGEYLELRRDMHYLCKGLVYPVPNPLVPFLGVHFTPLLNGKVLVGPNAVMALARDGYNWLAINPRDLSEALSFPGVWGLIGKYWKFAVKETFQSLFPRAQLAEIQKYYPQIEWKHLSPGRSGIRAQAMDRRGNLVDDFVFDCTTKNILHCRNVPSPAATSSLAIARVVADRVAEAFQEPLAGKPQSAATDSP